MQVETVKLYPTPQNAQCQGDNMPWRTVASYLNNLVEALPENERGSVKVSGLGNITLSFEHQLTEVEVMQGRLDKIRNFLIGAPRDGLTPEAVAHLQALVG